ncbi:MAG: aminotransferase class I/II-fold pyridoxal phosphate-dependent enzyme, partial [Planctomycetota bacterium]
MPVPVSDRLRRLPSYPFAVLGQKAAELRARGIEPIDFGVGDPRTPTSERIRAACRDAVDRHAASGYPPYRGSKRFRAAAADWMRRRFGVEGDAATQGTSNIG